LNFQIITSRHWRYRHPKKGWSVLEPGAYLVPEHLPTEVAELAITQGMAKRVSAPKVDLPPRVINAVETITNAVVKRRGRPKKAAPENKALHVAENK
jgi:hypothetical protein